MFGDKVCGLLQALERDLGNGFKRDALLGERLACKGGLVSRLHLAPCIRPRLRLLDPIVRRKPRLDRLVVAAMRLAGEIERERLVRLGGGVLGDALP
jgi:hypothetical protein